MKSSLFGLLLGMGLLVTHVGCCAVPMHGGGCGAVACGDLECESCGCGEFGGPAPLRRLGSHIVNHIHGARCGSGCGEIYVDEHINEPPVCDPCGCNGEYTGETCGSCPTALGRLRNLWGYRYIPSNCNECSTCGEGGMFTGGSSCASCGAGSIATHHDGITTSSSKQSMVQPNGASPRLQPTPATRPSTQPNNVVPPAPAPVPDPNASVYEPTDERLVIGSGVPTKAPRRSVQARPASTKSKAQRPKLVTNPN